MNAMFCNQKINNWLYGNAHADIHIRIDNQYSKHLMEVAKTINYDTIL